MVEPHPLAAELDLDLERVREPRERVEGRPQQLAQLILAFNGTTEWALDSVALEDALWLPHEHQLRELLRGAFRALRRLDDTHVVEIALGHAPDPEVIQFEHPEPADAYALALLEVLRRIS